jgi:asparagine synthase (glutamine-hydrolysing)
MLEVIDRAAAAFSVEPRHVCFDTRLAEFCLALPGEQKLFQGWTRMVMRRAMARILPEEVRSRGGKSDVSPALTRSLLDFNGRSAEEVILQDAKVIGDYVDVDAVRRAYQRYISEGVHYEAVKVWWAASLASWLRQADLGL